MPGVPREGIARLQQYISFLLLFRQQKRKLRGVQEHTGICKRGKCVHAQTEQRLTQPFGSSAIFFQKASAPSLLLKQHSVALTCLLGEVHFTLKALSAYFRLWRHEVEGTTMYGLLPQRGTLVWVKRKRNSSMSSFPSYFQKIKKLAALMLTIRCD